MAVKRGKAAVLGWHDLAAGFVVCCCQLQGGCSLAVMRFLLQSVGTHSVGTHSADKQFIVTPA